MVLLVAVFGPLKTVIEPASLGGEAQRKSVVLQEISCLTHLLSKSRLMEQVENQPPARRRSNLNKKR
jgi:hypothetical protein